ncbi:MAG: hypothetical protein QM802_11180 [Agriterribacter sp.]
MKKIIFSRSHLLLIVILFSVLISSCKKGDGTDLTKYYVKFKANGVQKNYPAVVGLVEAAPVAGATAHYTYSIAAAGDVDKDVIAIMVYTKDPIAQTTYYGKKEIPVSANATGSEVPLITYTDANNREFQSFNQPGYTVNAAGLVTDPAPFANKVYINWEVTISDLQKDYVKGTFSGFMYPLNDYINFALNGDQTYVNDKIAITDGEFYVQRY